ncbi:response regulator [Ideonella sp. DXS22W]|uniref:histidine kinase n=1 Tax=Pseudaquabacterium inlustre TaxID=2984192 RepID=A0ABU9CFZ8_9BURK
MFKSASLRTKLTLAIGLTGLVAALALALATRHLAEHQIEHAQQRLLTLAAQDVAARFAHDPHAHAGEWRRLAEPWRADGVQFSVTDAQGRVLIGEPVAGGHTAPASQPSEPTAAARPAPPEPLRFTDPDGRERLAMGVLAAGHGRAPGLGWRVVASTDAETAFAPARQLALLTAALGLLAVAVVTTGVWVALGRLLQPLRQMGDAAARLCQGALDTPMPLPRGHGEVAQCTRSLVALVHALQQRNLALRLTSRVFDESTQAIALCEADGTVITVNPAFETLTGHRPDQAPGQALAALLAADPGDATVQALAAPLQLGSDWAGEQALCSSDGRAYTAWLSLHALRDGAGHITHRVAMLDDITERQRHTQAQERHRHHLEGLLAERTAALSQAHAELHSTRLSAERAKQAKTDLLAGMSHEIRTPLNAIIGLTHLLARDGPAAATPQRPQLERIHGAATQLMGIVDDVLDLSRIEAGKVAVAHTAFSLADVMTEVHDMLAEAAARKGLALVLDLHDLPLRSLGDAKRLRQVLLNFASNAIKFTELGQVRLEGCSVQRQATRCRVRLGVADTGPGLDDAQQQRLFQPFEPLSSAGSPQPGGTGLGLVIARHLARLMGGEVGVHSAPGQGSRFWIELWLDMAPTPVALAPANLPARSDAETQLRQRRGLRVLLAEDNVVNQEVASALLESVGVQVDVVDDGLAAVAHVQRQRYDLILMDMQMPGMDGLAATRAIRQLPQGAAVPILAMTAHVFGDAGRACQEAGMNGHVTKPVAPETLFSKMLQWLPEGAAQAPAAVPAAEAASALTA